MKGMLIVTVGLPGSGKTSWVKEFIDKDVREYVRMTYLGREYNVLKSRGGKYRKIEEIRKWVDKN